MPRTGGVGLFCQSAAVGVATLNHAIRADLGVSSFISTGDYADVTVNDVMQYWEDDPATRVCLLSLDSIGNPRKFSRITRRLTRRKPVVVFAPGRTSRAAHAGVRGGLGHAPEEAIDALFRQAGVMVVHRRGAMVDIAKVAARQPLPQGLRVRLIANSVTLASQMRQVVDAVGLLQDREPVLLGVIADPAAFVAAARAALADDACDSVVCAAVNVFDEGTEDVILALEEVAAEATKPLLGVFLDFPLPMMSGGTTDEPGSRPRFNAAADAIYALSARSSYAHWRYRDPGAVPDLEVDEDTARRVVNQVLASAPEGRELTAPETAELLGAYGIGLVPRFPVNTVDASAMVRDLKAAPVLFGRHGAPGVDVTGIEDLLHRVAQLADAIPQLASVRLSPCIASLSSVSVLGAQVLIAPTADRRDPLVRML